MNDVELGHTLRVVRIRRGLRQSDVARTARVSQATISLVEHGYLEHTTLGFVRRVATALGVSVALEPRWSGADLSRLRDERHASTVLAVITRLTRLGWETRPEHTFNCWGERGSTDVLAWHANTRALLVVEVKTQIVDLQDLLATLDRKRRLATTIARDLGWRPSIVGALLAMRGETQARNAVRRFGPIFDAAYPRRGGRVQAWLRHPDSDASGVWFLNSSPDDAKRRPGGIFRVRPAGNRTPEPAPRRSGSPAIASCSGGERSDPRPPPSIGQAEDEEARGRGPARRVAERAPPRPERGSAEWRHGPRPELGAVRGRQPARSGVAARPAPRSPRSGPARAAPLRQSLQ